MRMAEENDLPVFTQSSFPPEDLMDTLVDLYFRRMNDHLPLLHEPTFREGIRARLHLMDSGFGATVLLVCANGSRFTRDPRVLLEGEDDPHSAGWKWYRLVDVSRRLPLAPAKLYDLQIYVVRVAFQWSGYNIVTFELVFAVQLMISYLQGTIAPHAVWTLIGVGIRIALEVGAHRKRTYASVQTVEEELWRRAFWCASHSAVCFSADSPQDPDCI